MIDQAQIESFRQNFIKEFANENYARFQAVRQKVRDCAAGSAVMKGVSKDDIHKIQEYLIPTERHRKCTDEYYRYAQMAAFPGYTESTLPVGMGLLGTGADTIEGKIAKKMVTPSGFEPKLTGPKPVVLPLHNGVTQDIS